MSMLMLILLAPCSALAVWAAEVAAALMMFPERLSLVMTDGGRQNTLLGPYYRGEGRQTVLRTRPEPVLRIPVNTTHIIQILSPAQSNWRRRASQGGKSG